MTSRHSRWLALVLLVAPGCADAEPGATNPDAADVQDAAPDAPETSDAADVAADVGTPEPYDPTPWVDPFVGTGADGVNFGARYPGANVPFGMVALSPDTEGLTLKEAGTLHAGGYFYLDTEVMGFSHNHLSGPGIPDYGNVLVLPQVGDPTVLAAKARVANLPLDHALEHAEPGYYRLEVEDPAVTAELTATARTGVHRYSFAPTADAQLIVDATATLGQGVVTDSDVTVDPATGEISGWLHNVGDFTGRYDGYDLWFVAVPSRAPDAVGTFDAGGYAAGSTTSGGSRAGAVLSYDATSDPVVELRVGISYVDLDGARANLAAEATGRSFDEVRAAAREAWRQSLGVVEVEGGTEVRRRLLYTHMFHAQAMPNLLSDVDGRYRGLDQEVHQADGWAYYTDFSMWDTYRTTHPLVTLLWPQVQRDFLRSLTAMAAEGGTMPAWPLGTGYTGSMIGTSADIVIGDAFDKGVTDFDSESAYQAMKALATAPAPPGHPGRDHYEECTQYGYCPADLVGSSVSLTLEFSADDFCLARVAELLGHADDAAMFAARSEVWSELFDPVQGFLAPRASTGEFLDYSPTQATEHYVEGNPWHYLFMVPHAAAELVALLGGAEPFVAKLSHALETAADGYEIGIPDVTYWHGNEPNIVAPWLFGFAGRRDLTAKWTAWLADNAYLPDPAGLAGNDDGGTLGAWYVFAGLGLYPLPCTGTYALGAPLFDRVVVHLAGGADLEILRGDDPDADPTFDGAPIAGPTIDHASLAGGGVLVLPAAP